MLYYIYDMMMIMKC